MKSRLCISIAVLLFSYQAVGAASQPSKAVFADAVNGFAFSLFKSLDKTTSKGNKFISPLSIYIALSMVYNGAGGQTRQELAEVLSLPPRAKDSLNTRIAGFMTTIQDIAGMDFTLQSANSVWVHDRYTLKDTFVKTIQTYYQAPVQILSFADAAAPLAINSWVSDKTGGRITDIVPQRLSPSLRLLLVNATYFKADWTYPFKASMTQQLPFSTLVGSVKKEVNVLMMSNTETYRHRLTADKVEMIELPYGKQSGVSMIVVMPKKGESIDSFSRGLTHKLWRQWYTALKAVKPAYGEIVLPKITMNYEASLNDPIRAMGMKLAFTEKADLTGISDGNLFVSDILHKTFLAVDEKGTEAAAVTAVKVGMMAMPETPLFSMKVNRPYIFALCENTTGTILFLASVKRPEV
ncbi:MAG: serpin family protein [Chitinivibrionales bacterium]|nr:serpin family protein [Chitinivibrionales bacterium]